MEMVEQVFIPVHVGEPFANKRGENRVKVVGMMVTKEGFKSVELFLNDSERSMFDRVNKSSDEGLYEVKIQRELNPRDDGSVGSYIRGFSAGNLYKLSAASVK